ncbi:hypothetical protein Trydic_g18906 [Trypoxylus dichotomus]
MEWKKVSENSPRIKMCWKTKQSKKISPNDGYKYTMLQEALLSAEENIREKECDLEKEIEPRAEASVQRSYNCKCNQTVKSEMARSCIQTFRVQSVQVGACTRDNGNTQERFRGLEQKQTLIGRGGENSALKLQVNWT